jgi:hypothetical protein
MMKIELLMKEYIGLYIYIYMKFCSHILQSHVRIPPVYGNNKQQTNYHISLFPNKMVFLENPMYTIYK